MSNSEQAIRREQAIRLAKQDTPAALACARDIEEPWYRCQALAWVANFAPEMEVVLIATEALQAAAQGADGYQRVAAAAWPIRALVERSFVEQADQAAACVLPTAGEIEHPGSRAEAPLLLLHATLPSPQGWRPVFERILEIPQPPTHWRHGRALRDACLMVHVIDPAFFASRLQRVIDPKTRRRIDKGIADPDSRHRGSREFFW